jgi:hypothetical protein
MFCLQKNKNKNRVWKYKRFTLQEARSSFLVKEMSFSMADQCYSSLCDYITAQVAPGAVGKQDSTEDMLGMRDALTLCFVGEETETQVK